MTRSLNVKLYNPKIDDFAISNNGDQVSAVKNFFERPRTRGFMPQAVHPQEQDYIELVIDDFRLFGQ